MHIALVADTHLPRFGRALPGALVRGIVDARVDRILHAGDWTQPVALELLERLAPVDGVAGNNDGPELHERFGTRRIIEVGGARIGLTHGHLGPGATTPARARRAFEDEPAGSLGAIVFGHSHVPLVERRPTGPGSSTRARRRTAGASRSTRGPWSRSMAGR
jgi:hypothetical protein